MFHRWWCVLWSWAVPSLLQTSYFLSFWYRLILISAVQRMLFKKCSGFFFLCFLAKSNLALFAARGEASVFALVKSSLDCRLWQRHVCLLESVLLLAGCCERVFLHHGEDPLMDVQAFLCCWAHQCVLFFLRMYRTVDLASPNVPALSLWWICFVFEA